LRRLGLKRPGTKRVEMRQPGMKRLGMKCVRMRRVGLILALILGETAWIALSGAGCGWLRIAYAPELGVRNTIVLSVHPDTTRPSVVVQETSLVVSPRPQGRPVVHKPPAATPPPPKEVVTVQPDTLLAEQPAEPEPPAISIALPPGERLRLTHTTLVDLAAADSILVHVAPRLSREKDRKKMATVQGLIEQARSALAREDIRSASNLAQKARVLAKELPR